MSKIVFEKDTVQGTIAEILHKHISNPLDTTRFVFATNVVASSWIDWTLDHEVSAIAMERFWAWDSFKSEFFNMSEEGKQSIPSLLRKIFVRSLLVRCFHEAKTGTPLFKALIPPSVASQSLEETVAFTDWVVSLLPSLRLWYTKYTAYKNKYPQAYTDDVDEDYLTLYHLYAAFLAGEDRKGPVFFDPAWISSSKVEEAVTALKDDYIIFYPEILEDWDEYRLYFEKSSHITIVSLPEESHMTETMKHPAATFYTNARSELRALALQIRRLCACKGEDAIPWNHIAVSVPDIATWRPYIQREFLLYGIPAVFRVGAPLTAGIGRLFRQLQNCYDHTFDYDSLRSLLLDSSIPWLKPERNEQLVRIGYETKCLCNDFSVTDAGDMWEQSLAASNTDNTSELDLRYYKSLKEHISKLCTANSFEKIYRQWFLFKKEFIQPDGFSASSDMLISRCITQLSALKDLEQQFFTELGLHCYSPYSFFVREIENTVYQPQIQQDGVSVFDYRVCAAGAYPYQFILNATQTDCSVQSQRFSFLSMTKRRELGISETANASDAFIRLYGANTHSVISCSEKTFSGFAIPYSLLHVSSKPVSFEVPADDFVRGMEHFLHDPHANHLCCISNMQKKGYDFWKFTQNACCDEYDSASAFYKAKVDKAVHAIPRWENDTYKHIGPVSVTQSDLNDFVKCPRYWLYHRVLRIEEETFDTVLLSSFDMGEVNHKILELFMKYCKQEHNGVLPCTVDTVLQFTTPSDENTIRQQIQAYTQQAIDDPSMRFAQSPLVKKMLHNQEAIISSTVFYFLKCLCVQDKGFGGQTVYGTELNLYAPVIDSAGKTPYVYHGFIDLLLTDSNDQDAVIDYKNTQSAIPTVGKCVAEKFTDVLNFQMLIYAKLWAGSGPNRTLSKAVFYAIKTGERVFIRNESDTGKTAVQKNAWFDGNLASLDQEVTMPFVKTVQSYDFTPDSKKVVPYRDCIACAYKNMCRTTFSVSGATL